MDRDRMSRRDFLFTGARLAMAGGVAGIISGCGDDGAAPVSRVAGPNAAACVDPGNLSYAEISLRQSVSYTDMAADPETVCGVCAYFHPEGANTCGRCDILQGIVSETGHCVSWAPQG